MIGYTRVSSYDQNPTLQRDALNAAGVRTIHEDKRSAIKRRPGLERALASLRPGDTLLVYKSDRLARSLADLLRILDSILRAGAHFRSLTEPFDTTTPAGRMALQMLGSVAEFERALIRERSMAGQAAARRRGARFGRPRKLDWSLVQRLDAQGMKPGKIAALIGAHHTAVRYILLQTRKSK